MSKRSNSLVVVIALVATASAACQAIQPKPNCKVQRADYAARYEVMGEVPAACQDKILSGERLHLWSYSPDPRKADDTPSLAIEPALVGDALAAAGAAQVAATVESENSFGKFTADQPGDEDQCQAKSLSTTAISVPAIPEDPTTMRAAADPVSVSYEWSNVRSLVKATSNGLYIAAQLKRTDGDCVMSYEVTMVSPAVDCGDGDGDPTTGNPNNAACCPQPDNGLSLDLAYRCDPRTLLCVVTTSFPSEDFSFAQGCQH